MKKNKQKCFSIGGPYNPHYIFIKGGRFEALSRDLPSFIEIFPSLKCNLVCPLCDRGRDDSELEDFNDIRILYDNFRNDPDCNLSGIRISGREPLLYHRINELISFLQGMAPDMDITLFTNGLALNKLVKKSLEELDLNVSIYRCTKKILRNDKAIASILRSKKIPVKANVLYHQDLHSPGKQKGDFDPLMSCFSAVLLCATKKVYPCCRAHRFEQMFKKKYHFSIHTKDLYQKLRRVISDTDLCSHCPRIYRDHKLVKC